MIRGAVNERGEAIVKLPVKALDGTEIEVAAIVDTGFDGTLTMPSSLLALLHATPKSVGSGLLADGSKCRYQVFEVTVVWNELALAVMVSAIGEDPLLGMGLLHGHELRMQLIPGGVVEIKTIP